MLRKIIITFFTFFLITSTLYAQEKEMGKFIGGKQTTMPTWFLNSFLELSDDIETLALENKRLMLFIEQDGCPYCNAFVTKNLNDKKTKEKLLKYFGVIDINMFGSKEMVDIDGEELTEKEFAIKHKIQFTPTLIFYDENKKQILRLNGYIDIPQFNLALDYIISKKEKELSYKEFLSKNNKTNKNDILIKEADLFKDSKNFMRASDAKKMAVFFETPNCPQCETLHNKLLKDKTTRKLLKN